MVLETCQILVTGFTQFTLLEEKTLQTEICGPGRREIDEKAVNIQARSFKELWMKLGKNAKLKERQKWSDEKPSIMLARNWKSQWLPPCLARQGKNSQHGVTRGKSNEIKSKLACILEASESTRLRMGGSLPNHHEDHIVGKGDNSLQHYISYTHLFLCLKL